MLFAAHLLNNVYILKVDNTPFIFDSYGYFCRGVEIFRWLHSCFKEPFNPVTTMTPLFPFSSALCYCLFGVGQDTACYANAVFLFILLYAVYKVGEYMGNGATGLLAAFIVSTYPVVMAFSRHCMPEFSLMAMVSLTLYALTTTEFFTRIRASLFLGLVIGGGLLTKMTYPGFVIGPILYFFFGGILMHREKTPRIIRNFLLALLIAVLVSFFWYKTNFMAQVFRYQSDRGIPYDIHGFRLDERTLYYLFALHNSQMWWPYYILFLIALGIMLLKGPEKLIFPGAAVLVPYLIFSSLEIKNGRHIIAYLPGFAVITAWGLQHLFANRAAHRVLMTCVVALGIGQAVFISYCPQAQRFIDAGAFDSNSTFVEDPYGANEFRIHQTFNMGLWRPNRNSWGAERMLSLIKEDTSYGKKTIKIGLVNASARVFFALHIKKEIERPPIEIQAFYTEHTRDLGLNDTKKFFLNRETAGDLDYLGVFTYKTDPSQPPDAEDLVCQINSSAWSDILTLIDSFSLPEDTVAYFYKNVDPRREKDL